MFKKNVLSLFMMLGFGFSLMGSEGKPTKIFDNQQKEQLRIQLEADKKTNNRNMTIAAASAPVGIAGLGLLAYNGSLTGDTGFYTMLMSIPCFMGYVVYLYCLSEVKNKTDEEYNKLMQEVS